MSSENRQHLASRAGGVSFLLWLMLALYLVTFWGRFVDGLPPPWRGWGFGFRAYLYHWYRVQPELWLGAQLVLGLAIPAGLFALVGRSPRQLGLRRPGRLGLWLAAAGAVVGAIAGLWLSGEVGGPLPGLRWFYRQVAIVPQHFLLFGVGMAVWLPRFRLKSEERIQGLGLTPAVVVASLAAGLLFLFGHVGKGNPLELAIVWPCGALFAYITHRTGSIWPALVPHWFSNLAPLAWSLLMAGRA